jgi:hypothetical protein
MDTLQTHFANLCHTLRAGGKLTAAELSTGMLCICCLQLAGGKEIELATLFLDKGADSNNPALFTGAIMYNQLDLLRLLCQRAGANIKSSEDIMYDCIWQGRKEALEILLDHGWNPDGSTGLPLQSALDDGEITSAMVLLQAGANPDYHGDARWSGISAASSYDEIKEILADKFT